jgi:hypothetical protein
MNTKSGEVIAINLTDNDFTLTHSIKVRLTPNNHIVIAFPLNANIKRVPIIGESVIIVSGTLPDGSAPKTKARLYYLDVISIQQNVHSNALPTVAGVPSTQTGGDYSAAAAGNAKVEGGDSSADLGEKNPGFVERTDVGSLQPFLGDLLIEGRFGHSLRFGYSPEGANTTEEPSWNSSTPEDPITILSNGRKPAGSYNKFIIENVDEDLSSIWLTSSQKVKLSVSNKLPSDVDAQSQFDKPSVILNSDRIILNSKSDWVVLSGAKSVALTTPSWAMDMDKLFTIIEGLIQQVADLTSAKATFATGVGPTGPATNVANVTKLLTDLKKMGGSSTPPPPPSPPAVAAGGRPGAGASNANFADTDDDTVDDTDDDIVDDTADATQSNTNCTTPAATWDKTSDRRIKTLHPLIQCDVASIINEAEATLGVKFRITQALRTIEQQNGLYAKGRTAPGGIVTNARGGKSFHNYGLAFDVAIIKGRRVIWKSPDYKKLSTIASKYGFFWGGNFKSLNDEPHFERGFGNSTSTLFASVKNSSSPYPSNLA